MTIALSAVLAIVLSVVANELYAWLPTFADWILRRYAARLPDDVGQRMLEEWRAMLFDTPGNAVKLYRALDLGRTIDRIIEEASTLQHRPIEVLNSFTSLDPLVSQVEAQQKLWHVYVTFAPLLQTIARSRSDTRQSVGADDITQDAFLILTRQAMAGNLKCLGYRKLQDVPDEELRHNLPKLRSYLVSIVSNKCRDLHRKNYRRPEESLSLKDDIAQEKLSDPLDALVQAERLEDVRAAIQRLSPNHQEIISLRFYADFKLVEIAEQLGVPLGTVKTRLREAIEKLKLAMGES